MADYTYAEIMKMQNDAIKRVEDMQKKARKTAGIEDKADEKVGSIPVQKPERVPMPNDYLEKLKDYASNSSHREKAAQEDNYNHKRNGTGQNAKDTSAFGDFNMDEDKALLLSLIMLLSEEKCDELLIMALIYMLT